MKGKKCEISRLKNCREISQISGKSAKKGLWKSLYSQSLLEKVNFHNFGELHKQILKFLRKAGNVVHIIMVGSDPDPFSPEHVSNRFSIKIDFRSKSIALFCLMVRCVVTAIWLCATLRNSAATFSTRSIISFFSRSCSLHNSGFSAEIFSFLF
jgi:hypothetical protein